MVEYTDRNGRVTTYEYDNLHQLAAEKWWNGESLARTISYDFDLLGNLLSISDPSATYEYAYDALNRVTSVGQTIAGLAPVITFEKKYDAASRMIASHADIGGTADYANSYVYDALGRLTSVTQTDNGGHAVSDKRVDFTYSDRNQLEGIVRYASAATANLVAFSQFTYDEHGRLIYLGHTSVGSFAEEYGYDYDGAGRLASFSSLFDGFSVDYAYDPRHQLLEADYTGGPADEEYEYDENGNRINGGFAVDTNNKLLSDGTYTYEYDNEGNRIRRTSASGDYTVYAWDHRNRLVSVIEMDAHGTPTDFGDDVATQRIDHVYDPFNQLVKTAVDPDGDLGSDPVEQAFYSWDDGQTVLQFDKTGSGDVAAGDLSHRYLWGAAVDQLFADEQVADLFDAGLNEILWALTDHLRSVRDAVDSEGTLRLHRQFDSFGNILNTSYYDAAGDPVSESDPEAVTVAFAFTGKLFEIHTGLQYNLHRWYDPTVGRWLSEDPVGFADGDANLYRYVGNQPTDMVDPSGLAVETGWDAFNVGMGVTSFGFNIYVGNWWAAVEDAGGIVVDTTATAVPFVPGGAATALKVKRGAGMAADALKAGDKAKDALKAADKAKDAAKIGKKTGDYLDKLGDAKEEFHRNKDFKDWMHRQYDKLPGGGKKNPDFTDDDFVDGWELWNELGKPGRKSHTPGRSSHNQPLFYHLDIGVQIVSYLQESSREGFYYVLRRSI